MFKSKRCDRDRKRKWKVNKIICLLFLTFEMISFYCLAAYVSPFGLFWLLTNEMFNWIDTVLIKTALFQLTRILETVQTLLLSIYNHVL